jgi:hypothetical protein
MSSNPKRPASSTQKKSLIKKLTKELPYYDKLVQEETELLNNIRRMNYVVRNC